MNDLIVWAVQLLFLLFIFFVGSAKDKRKKQQKTKMQKDPQPKKALANTAKGEEIPSFRTKPVEPQKSTSNDFSMPSKPVPFKRWQKGSMSLRNMMVMHEILSPPKSMRKE